MGGEEEEEGKEEEEEVTIRELRLEDSGRSSWVSQMWRTVEDTADQLTDGGDVRTQPHHQSADCVISGLVQCCGTSMNQLIQQLPSSPPLTVRVAVHEASPALLQALHVYWPACSLKASTMMSVAVLVSWSK